VCACVMQTYTTTSSSSREVIVEFESWQFFQTEHFSGLTLDRMSPTKKAYDFTSLYFNSRLTDNDK